MHRQAFFASRLLVTLSDDQSESPLAALLVSLSPALHFALIGKLCGLLAPSTQAASYTHFYSFYVDAFFDAQQQHLNFLYNLKHYQSHLDHQKECKTTTFIMDDQSV